MKKTERIAELEREVAELRFRLDMIERNGVVYLPQPVPPPPSPYWYPVTPSCPSVPQWWQSPITCASGDPS